MPLCPHCRETLNKFRSGLIPGRQLDHLLGHIIERYAELVDAPIQSFQNIGHRRSGEVHRVAFPYEICRKVKSEAIRLKKAKEAVGNIRSEERRVGKE